MVKAIASFGVLFYVCEYFLFPFFFILSEELLNGLNIVILPVHPIILVTIIPAKIPILSMATSLLDGDLPEIKD